MATTIRIDEAPHPLHPTRSDDSVISNGHIDNGVRNMRDIRQTASSSSGIERDGIYNIRALTRTFSRSSSARRQELKKLDEQEPEDDDPGLRQPGDFKGKQVFNVPMRPFLISLPT